MMRGVLVRAIWVFAFAGAVYGASSGASPAECAQCHRAQTTGFAPSAMSHALETVKDCAILREHPKLTVTIGKYVYEISRAGDESIYTVSDGRDTLRLRLSWAFGQGSAGQTYLFQFEGYWYESRVSYYTALRGLDLTMGAQNKAAASLGEAAGRVMGPTEAGECFNCHATNAVTGRNLSLSTMVESVQCERCHGAAVTGGGQHVRAVRAGDARNAAVRKLGQLNAEEMSDLCGQCHRTWADIADNGPRGSLNVRFQPYRLTLSKCYDAEDRRMRCTSCHDPHRALETSAAAYDAKCRACHSPNAAPATGASAHICKVATRECVNCHMPAVDLPGAHKKFTDHMIRIVKAGGSYPD